MAVKNSIVILLMLVPAFIYCAEADNKINIIVGVMDVYVKNIYVTRNIDQNGHFEFRDLQNEKDDSDVKTIVSGTCAKIENKFKIIAHRVTIKNNKVVRSNWFDQVLDPITDDKRVVFGASAMESVTIFDIRLKDYVSEE